MVEPDYDWASHLKCEINFAALLYLIKKKDKTRKKQENTENRAAHTLKPGQDPLRTSFGSCLVDSFS